MVDLKTHLQEEQSRLKRILKTTGERLKIAPEGKLRIGKCQGIVQYYHRRDDTSNNGIYLSKTKASKFTWHVNNRHDTWTLCLRFIRS